MLDNQTFRLSFIYEKKRIDFSFLIAIFMFLNFGCSEKSKITEAELISFCEELETSIIQGNPAVFNDALYETGLQKRVFEGYNAGGNLTYILNNTLNNHFRLGDGILNTVLDGDFIFEVTRIYRDENDYPWAVFRLFNGTHFNYIEFQFEKILDKIRISEAYYYNTGQNLSETLRDIVFLEIGFDGKSEKDPMIKKYYREGIQFWQAAQQKLLVGNYEMALDTFDYMDRRLIEKPFFATQRLTILSHLNEEKTFGFLEKFNSLFPNETKFNLLNDVQISMYNGEVEKTRKAIHNLSKLVGNDSVLDYYEANALLNNGDYEKAVFYFDKFIEQKPGLTFGYFGKAVSWIEGKNYEKAALCIKDILQEFSTNIADLEMTFENYPEFLESEEYLLWKKGSGIM